MDPHLGVVVHLKGQGVVHYVTTTFIRRHHTRHDVSHGCDIEVAYWAAPGLICESVTTKSGLRVGRSW
jgi:hypothetical protein